jgi:flagellar motor switch/type III secretory pathway protein FliN
LAAIGRLEFVIEALEKTVPGWRPARFGAADGLGVQLDLRAEDGQLVHRLALVVPESVLAKLAARPPDLSRLPQDVPLAAVLIVPGPTIPAVEVVSLAVGDLVWLGDGGPCEARVQVAGVLRAEGQFDPALRQFRSSTPLRPAPSCAGEAPMSLDVDEISGPRASRTPLSLEDLPVRIRFEFGPWAARLADVAQIAPGCVLPAPAGDAEPEVRLTVEGRLLARGRLVALGRQYGVLVDSVES